MERVLVWMCHYTAEDGFVKTRDLGPTREALPHLLTVRRRGQPRPSAFQPPGVILAKLETPLADFTLRLVSCLLMKEEQFLLLSSCPLGSFALG